MGRRSVKENKSIYQVKREEMGLTREKASERMATLSEDRIEKIENGKVIVQPEDVLEMAEAYNAPALCNYFCTHECAIGEEHVEVVELKELSQIAVETLNALNRMEREKDRLLEIVEDGTIRSDERADFIRIKKTLERIGASVDALQLWLDQRIAEGKLDGAMFEEE